MRRRRWTLALLVAAALAAGGCHDARRYEQAVGVLIDVSGTYADEKAEVARILKRDVLPALEPGDTLVVIRIDSESYEKDNVEIVTTLDPRPSQANAQKLAVAQRLDAFAAGAARSEYTDLPGAMMLAAEYLREIDSGSRVLLVFSDLREELPEGAKRTLDALEFEGIRVAAMNVKRLAGDTHDPQAYRDRLALWQRRVERAGAQGWRAFSDPRHVSGYLVEVREAAPPARAGLPPGEGPGAAS